MATVKRPFIDTSILLGGMIDFGESSQTPMALLDLIAEKRIRNAVTAWHCCLEFYSVATRLPEEYRLSTETAEEFVTVEIMDRLQVYGLEASRWKDFFAEAAQSMVRGGRVYDFHIGRVAVDAKSSVIITENKKHFSPFAKEGLQVLTAKEFLREW